MAYVIIGLVLGAAALAAGRLMEEWDRVDRIIEHARMVRDREDLDAA